MPFDAEAVYSSDAIIDTVFLLIRTETGCIGAMKLVTAIIKPFKLDEVREVLIDLGVHGMTATEVKGYGRQKGQSEMYRGAEYEISFLPKMKLELIVSDEMVDRVIAAVQNQARTGRIGDGKIFVTDCASAVRIRTGETGNEAL